MWWNREKSDFSKNEIAKILEYSLYTAKAGKVKLRDMKVVMAVK